MRGWNLSAIIWVETRISDRGFVVRYGAKWCFPGPLRWRFVAHYERSSRRFVVRHGAKWCFPGPLRWRFVAHYERSSRGFVVCHGW